MAGFRSLLAAGLLTLSACTWVTLTEAGAEVRVAEPPGVAGCGHVGVATASTGALWRGDAKIREELVTLASNEAARLGGDAIVPRGAPEEGRQEFDIYRCD